MFRFTFAHHPVPVRSLLDGRLGPDGDVSVQSGRSSKLFLGARFQTELGAWQMTQRALDYQTRAVRVQALRAGWEKVKLTLFLYMWSDTALGGRVNGEYASICTAFHVSVHPTSALVDGSFEDFGFPTVQESGVEAVPGSIAVGEHERLLGVQSVPFREGVELGSVPVNLDLDLGKGHRVRRICTLSVDCEGNVGLVVIGIKIL